MRQIADLRRRIAATRWPEKETLADENVQLATMQKPKFITEIDGFDIHFIQVRFDPSGLTSHSHKEEDRHV